MENITAGKAEVEAKLDGIKLYSHTFDLCKEVLPQVNLPCPVAAGQHSITIKTKIPEAAPRVRSYMATTVLYHQCQSLPRSFNDILASFGMQ